MAYFSALPVSKLWSSYTASLAQYPLRTKCLTSFTGFIFGDAIAQKTEGNKKFDIMRTSRFALYGLLVHAPTCHMFYRILDKVVMPQAASSGLAIVSKVCIDQLVFTPIMTGVFYVVLKTMEGKPDQIGKTLKEKYVKTLKAGYAIWPLAHIVNFRFVPSEQRVLYVNAVQLGFSVILSRIASAPSGGSVETELTRAKKELQMEAINPEKAGKERGRKTIGADIV